MTIGSTYHTFDEGHESLATAEAATNAFGSLHLAKRKSQIFWNTVNRQLSAAFGVDDDMSDDGEDEGGWLLEGMVLQPRRGTVEKVIGGYWRRMAMLTIVPVAIVIAWCAIPLPTYPNPALDPDFPGPITNGTGTSDSSFLLIPKEGEPKVLINFWFFLFVYYGFYNAIGLLWVTKLYHLYALNWWPSRLGGATSYTLLWCISIAGGAAIYLISGLERFLLTWILLTFATMSTPMIFSFSILRSNRRHSWHSWRSSLNNASDVFFERVRYVPESWRRFLWFSGALGLGLVALVAGEAYTYIYMSTLPHSAADALVYVYTWVATVHLLDLTTCWILGEGRVNSYSLTTAFKFYYAMTLNTYLRNLYARLRSPQQFALLQAASSTSIIVVAPLTMTTYAWRVVGWLTGLVGGGEREGYEEWKKKVGRGVYIQTLAKDVTMMAFLGWVAVLHFGPNRDAYPYFGFEDKSDPYTYRLTTIASSVVWVSEIVSAYIARRIIYRQFGFSITKEAVKDFKEHPDLVPSLQAVAVHVLQNMLFSLLTLAFA
ncbi:hypothetical protein YB2330_002923 [Saitoella coloradoensis]